MNYAIRWFWITDSAWQQTTLYLKSVNALLSHTEALSKTAFAVFTAFFVFMRVSQARAIARADLILKLYAAAKDFDETIRFLEFLRHSSVEVFDKDGDQHLQRHVQSLRTSNQNDYNQGLEALNTIRNLCKSLTESDEMTPQKRREYNAQIAVSLEAIFDSNWKASTRGFLRLCETIMLMIDGRVVYSREIFALLCYRILLVTNITKIQKTFLIGDSGNLDVPDEEKEPNYSFVAVFALHSRAKRYAKTKLLADFQYDDSQDLQVKYPTACRKAIRAYKRRTPYFRRVELFMLRIANYDLENVRKDVYKVINRVKRIKWN